ncbi:hypothetical protein BH10ACT1_BH10ACT1_05400 [soil metagenome]
MEELTLPVPVLVDVIPVEQADALILAARQDLADLHQAVASAQFRAEATERRAQAAGADCVVLGRAAEGVQRYIEHQRELADGELKGLLEQAADQARERVERARDETNRHTADARRVAALSSSSTPATDPTLGAGTSALAPGPAEALWIDPVTPPREAVPVETPRSGPSEDWSWLTAEPEQVEQPEQVDDVAEVRVAPVADLGPWKPAEPEVGVRPELPPPGSFDVAIAADLADVFDVDEATPAELPAATPARRGSVPVFALLQVAGLVAVLIVLLVIVG